MPKIVQNDTSTTWVTHYIDGLINLVDFLEKEAKKVDTVEYYEDRFPFRKAVSSSHVFKGDIGVDSITFWFDSKYKGIYWLILFKNGKRQEIKVDWGKFDGWSVNDDLCHPDICFGHYNNDNYVDFYLDKPGGTAGWFYEVYLFNPANKVFEWNEILSSDANLSYNRQTNVYQFMGRGEGWRYVGERFKLENGKKKVIKTLDVDRDNTGEKLKVIRKFILGEDTLVQTYKVENVGEEWLFSEDPYCKNFLEFKLKYRLKVISSDAPVKW